MGISRQVQRVTTSHQSCSVSSVQCFHHPGKNKTHACVWARKQEHTCVCECWNTNCIISEILHLSFSFFKKTCILPYKDKCRIHANNLNISVFFPLDDSEEHTNIPTSGDRGGSLRPTSLGCRDMFSFQYDNAYFLLTGTLGRKTEREIAPACTSCIYWAQ